MGGAVEGPQHSGVGAGELVAEFEANVPASVAVYRNYRTKMTVKVYDNRGTVVLEEAGIGKSTGQGMLGVVVWVPKEKGRYKIVAGPDVTLVSN